MFKITEPEYVLMKQYIEDHCGIHLERGKEYLIESRLTEMVIENGCNSFQEFHVKARLDMTGKLKEQIIDAMTTNETLWFRDDTMWQYLHESGVPHILECAAANGKARVWSAAVSTGQEVYSFMMLLDEVAKANSVVAEINNIDVLATDISASAISLAKDARYDSVAMNRGLSVDRKKIYFTREHNIWAFDSNLKRRVRFRQFNLQNSFGALGEFDLILCRYVLIYFSDAFKRDIFQRMARALHPGGILILGASESLRGYSDAFDIIYFDNAVINIKK